MTDTPELDKLLHRLFGDPERECRNFNVFWGEKAHLASPEDRAKSINDAFDAMERGEFEEIPPGHLDAFIEQTDVRTLVFKP